jgi:hypothetical protein
MVQGFGMLTLGLANQSGSGLRTRIREGSTTTIEETSLCSEIIANMLINESQIAFVFQWDPRKRIRPLPLSDRITQRFLDVSLLQVWVLGDNFLA